MNFDSIYIYGKHPVLEKIQNSPKTVEKIFIKNSLDVKVVKEIEELASRSKVPFIFVPEKKLEELSNNGNHQGLVALISSVSYVDLKGWLESVQKINNPCVIALDELEDPHNVGAIIRTSAALGVHGIIIPKHRQAPITGVAYKTSAGSVDKIPLIRVTNLNDTLRTLKENRFWVVGLDQKAKENIWKQDLDMSVCFVVGSEGGGIREKTKELCDFLTMIPMENNVESLNASVSTALVLGEWKRRRI
jgi:23S rRNA (guanosine2251-2'-O)-methyltransferase